MGPNVINRFGIRRGSRTQWNMAQIRFKTCVQPSMLDCQAKWFEYERLADPRSGKEVLNPKGQVCHTCGALCESWPLLSFDQVKEKLASSGSGDLLFQFNWDIAKKRLLQKAAMAFNAATVKLTTKSGSQARWLFAWVENSVFEATAKKDPALAALKMRAHTITDPDGHQRDGVLLRQEDMPNTLPWIEVVLFTETTVTHDEFMLDKSEGLHAEHAKNLLRYQEVENAKKRKSVKELEAAPGWLEVLERVQAIDNDTKKKEADGQRRMALADAAAAAAEKGDVATQAKLARAAAAASMTVSSSRLKRNEPSAPQSAPTPTKRLGKKGASGGHDSNPSQKKHRFSSGSATTEPKKGKRSKIGAGGAGHDEDLNMMAINPGQSQNGIDDADTLFFEIVNNNYSPGRERRWVSREITCCCHTPRIFAARWSSADDADSKQHEQKSQCRSEFPGWGQVA